MLVYRTIDILLGELLGNHHKSIRDLFYNYLSVQQDGSIHKCHLIDRDNSLQQQSVDKIGIMISITDSRSMSIAYLLSYKLRSDEKVLKKKKNVCLK